MPTYALYHNQLTTFDPARTAYGSNPIAFVDAVDPDHVFALTQHFEQAWYLHPSVRLCVRSTNVGDKIVDKRGMSHIIAPVGFEPPRTPLSAELVLANLQTMIENRHVDPIWLPVLVEAYSLLLASQTASMTEHE